MSPPDHERHLWGCWGQAADPKNDDDEMKVKSLGAQLTEVSGRSLTIQTASETNVCNSVREGLRRASPITLFKALLNNLTILFQLPP